MEAVPTGAHLQRKLKKNGANFDIGKFCDVVGLVVGPCNPMTVNLILWDAGRMATLGPDGQDSQALS